MGKSRGADLLVRTKLLLSLHYQVSRLLSIVPALASLLGVEGRRVQPSACIEKHRKSIRRIQGLSIETYTLLGILPEFG